MSNVIRNLLIKVGADLSGAQRGFATLSRDMKRVGKNFTSAGATLTKGLTMPIIGAVAGLAALTIKSASAADELVTMSNKTGLSTDRLQELEYAARFVDVAVDTMTGSMQKLTKNMDLARQGSDQQKQAFKALGIQITNQDGSLRNAKDVWYEAIDALGAMGNEAERDAMAMRIFGKSAVELNPLIKAGSTELKRLGQEAHTVGAVLSKDNVYALAKFDDQMQKFRAVLKTAGAELGAAFLPVLQSLIPVIEQHIIPAVKKFAEWLGGLVTWFKELSPPMQNMILLALGIAVAIGPMLTITGKLITSLGNMAKGISGAIKAGGGFTKILTGAIGPAGMVVLAITAIVAIVGVLTAVFGDMKSETQKVRDEINDLTSTLKSSKKAYDELVVSNEAQAVAADKLADELDALSKKEKKSETDKKRMKAIVDQLNSTYSDLALEIDDTTGALNKNTSSVKAYIAAKKEEARVTAAMSRYTQLLEEQYAIETNLIRAKEDLSNAQKAVNENVAIAITNINSLGGVTGGAARNVEDLTKEQKENARQQKALDKIIGGLTDTMESATSGVGALADAESDAAFESAEVLAQRERDLEEYQQNVKAAYDTHMGQMGGIYDKEIKMNKTSADKVKQNLIKQVEQFRKWQSDIRLLAGRVPADVAAELTKLGPESAPLIADLTTKTDTYLKDWVKVWKSKSEAAGAAAVGGLVGVPGGAQDVIDDTSDVFKENSQEGAKVLVNAFKLGRNTTKAVAGGSLEKIGYIRDTGALLGYSMSQGMAKGIKAGASLINNAAAKAAWDAYKAAKKALGIASPSKKTAELGRMFSKGFGVGIMQQSDYPIKSAALVANKTLNATSANNTDFSSLAKAINQPRSLNVTANTNNAPFDQKKMLWQLEREIVKAVV